MSFVRVGGRHPPRKKKTVKPRPWDDTISDLDAYKATPEEIAYRKSAHRSKHAVVTHLNRPGSARKGKRASPFRNNSNARKIAIMKEVLYDQKQLQEVLEKSDTMMAVVKDLFGDDPRRFAGIPSVTTAPNSRKADIASSLINLPPDIRTRIEDVSDSMMNQSALNELQDSGSDLDESHPVPLSYQPKMNMQRFQQFLEAEEKNTTLSTISGQAGMSHLGQTLASQINSRNVQSSHLPDQTAFTSKDGSFQTPPKDKKNLDESVEILRPPKSAMNDTNKINKTKRRVPKPEPPQNTSNLSLNELRKVLETLEDEVAEYERQTGRRPPAERHRQESFSGYTLAIVDSVTKLTRYLKECELRLQAEVTVREHLAQDVIQFKALVDALTSDIILTQEEFHGMSTEFQRFRQETRAEIQRLKGEPPQTSQQWSPAQSVNSNLAEPVQTQTPPKAQQYQEQDLLTKLPREINPFGEHLQPVSAAVMLSPPVRRSRVTEPERGAGKQQGSLLDLQDYVSSVESNNSVMQEDFAELPGLCTTSLAQVINPYNVAQTSQSDRGGSQTSGSHLQIRAPVTMPVNSVNVPKPTPLVQSNLGIPLPSGSSGFPSISSQQQQLPQSFFEKNQPITIKPQDRPQTFQRSHDQNGVTSSNQSECSEKSHDSMVPGSDKEFLASQIAELNKQHAEAQKRLNSLMYQQQAAQGQGQNELAKQQQQIQLQQAQQQQQGQQARQQVVENQQRIQQQQLQYDQQQRLLEMVMQQQQRIQEQQQQQKRQQQLQEQQQQELQQQPVQQIQRPKPTIPQEMTNGMPAVRESTELPGYRPVQKQPGLPAHPVSPNISPISQRSENYRMMFQSVDSQNASVSAPMGRGITVSIPKVDMDQSVGTPSPNPQQTAR